MSVSEELDLSGTLTPMNGRRRLRDDVLQLGPRKKACIANPLIHFGRHFGRTIHALCNVSALITNGLLRLSELVDEPEETFTDEQRRQFRVFEDLLQLVPGLKDRILNGTSDEVSEIAELIQKGAASARSDDTKSIKGPIIDWIGPPGEPLRPPLARNIKMDRGFNHERTGALLCPVELDWDNLDVKKGLQSGELAVSGDQWPLFLFANYKFQPEEPWDGLFRSNLLVCTFRHIFTSPSSVEKEPKATRSGNARIHGMTSVTRASIAYVATQTRFALSSSAVFSRTDTATDSERFYNTVLEFLDDVEEKSDVESLLMWWNRKIFPGYSSSRPQVKQGTALARLAERRRRMREETQRLGVVSRGANEQ